MNPPKPFPTLLAKQALKCCKDLETLPPWLPRLPLLEELIIRVCPKFRSWGTEEEEITEDKLPLPNLDYMEIDSCKDLETLPAWLPRLPLLNRLFIEECPKFRSWGMEEEMTTLPNLEYMTIASCKDLETLPPWLPRLPLLKELFIKECPKFRSWGMEEEMTALPNLEHMIIASCKDLETLPPWLPRLPSLKELIIKACPKIHSLPQDNLPSSLEKLHLIECDPSLMERCQQEGSLEWQKIQHIPHQQYT